MELRGGLNKRLWLECSDFSCEVIQKPWGTDKAGGEAVKPWRLHGGRGRGSC